MNYQSFTKLDVYKKCRFFRREISKMAKDNFPDEEKYLLKSEIVRSSRSVTANIGEGHGRYYYKETVKFCRTSRGSLEETLEHLITAYDEEYITKEVLKEMKATYDECMKLLNGYIRYLKKIKRGDEGAPNH
jgi:four helix bundle protein